MTAHSLLDRARALAESGTRRVLGIAGPPGAGKSTLAEHLAHALGPRRAVVAPMDGFHLADVELERLGRADRKGAPDTFDISGYLALLRRVRAPRAGEVVYAPSFARDLEQPIAGSIPIPAEVPLVITEGNYLLHDAPGWRDIRTLLDACWWVDVDDEERVRRLIARHERFGKSPEHATRFVHECDEANARLVAPGAQVADLIVSGKEVPT